jgi:hypothetical protein
MAKLPAVAVVFFLRFDFVSVLGIAIHLRRILSNAAFRSLFRSSRRKTATVFIGISNPWRSISGTPMTL